MKGRNIKIISGATAAILIVVLLIGILIVPGKSSKDVIVSDATSFEVSSVNPVAGVVVDIMSAQRQSDSTAGYEIDIINTDYEIPVVSEVEDAVSVAVEESDNQADINEESKPVDSDWSNKLMANVDEKLNVRMEPSENASLAGKLRKGDVAEITEVTDGWYRIISGNLEGYVSADYCVTGDEAFALSEQVCEIRAIPLTDGLRIREEASEEADIVSMINTDDRPVFDSEKEAVEGWVAVNYFGESGYIKSEYVTVEREYSKGITMEEERALMVKKKVVEAKKQGISVGSPISANHDDVVLLGAIISCEAGSYDGMLAVAGVICNRAKRGYGGGSIRGVIYQSGQFPPATNGKMDSVLSRGVSGGALTAAQEALAGVDITGGCVNFGPASSRSGRVIGGNAFY